MSFYDDYPSDSSKLKISLSLSCGVILESTYILLRYLIQPEGISTIFYSLIFLTANVSLIFGIYFWSLNVSKSCMFLSGSLALLFGFICFLVFILEKIEIFMDLGITMVLIGIFLLFFWMLVILHKKSEKTDNFSSKFICV
ncbi:MAG: hypothetical protein DRO88_12755 [Promethearchaeia archaeon]|nr:MAG: hypothetical protein DRO88_12755 [Candidatus Lokiarchaeia archaeon]